MIRHKGCGGEVRADWSLQYGYDGHFVPAHRCGKCGREILGDAEVDFGNSVGREYKVRYMRARREYLAIVYRTIGNVTHVLTVGCEDTYAAADDWARGTVELMDREDSDQIELPDKYERMLPT